MAISRRNLLAGFGAGLATLAGTTTVEARCFGRRRHAACFTHTRPVSGCMPQASTQTVFACGTADRLDPNNPNIKRGGESALESFRFYSLAGMQYRLVLFRWYNRFPTAAEVDEVFVRNLGFTNTQKANNTPGGANHWYAYCTQSGGAIALGWRNVNSVADRNWIVMFNYPTSWEYLKRNGESQRVPNGTAVDIVRTVSRPVPNIIEVVVQNPHADGFWGDNDLLYSFRVFP